METQTFISQFAEDVHNGLTSNPKNLSSRYFYDARGDKIFQQIMRMPEYYLTDCEFEIFEKQKDQIIQNIGTKTKFNLVELGAGDGYKTKILLQYLIDQKIDFEYFPVDISRDVLSQLKGDLLSTWPNLNVTTLNYEYFTALKKLNELDQSPKLILFLGSNIGNFSLPQTNLFFEELNSIMQCGDMLLSGIDLKKDPKVILDAYNDKGGITREFNMNLLTRMNRELGGDFDLDQFDHYPSYDPHTGEARSYIISKVKQDVYLEATDNTYSFSAAEAVHMEISRKYSLEQVENLANGTGFQVKRHFTDSRNYFVDTLWQKCE